VIRTGNPLYCFDYLEQLVEMALKENADSLPAAGRLVAVAPPFAESTQGGRTDNG
jgi:hypothetical protein